MTDTVRWAKAEDQDGPPHAWLDHQAPDQVWVSLCRWYADPGDLVDGDDESARCGSCSMLAHGLDLAEQHGDDLAWRP